MNGERKARARRPAPGFFGFLVIPLLLASLMGEGALSQERSIVGSISLYGNRSFSAGQVRDWLGTTEGGHFSASDLEGIVRGYVAEGYLFARVDSASFVPTGDSSEADLSIWIDEGKPAFVSSIRIAGTKGVSERELLDLLETAKGKRFYPGVLERDIQTVLRRYEDFGYLLARVVIQDVAFQDEREQVLSSVILSVDEGARVRLSDFRIEGNTSTKADVILREARWKPGAIFQENQPERIKRRLEKLQLFSSVSMPELYLDPDGTAGLLVKVREGNPNRFDGVVGYVPSAGPGNSGYVTGLLNLEFRNILGTGRKLSTRWYRENQASQEVELRYLEPWVATYPVNLEGDFFQRKQDSTYVLRRYEISAHLMATEDLTVALSYRHEDVFPTQGFGVLYVDESSTASVGVSISYDSRDDPVTPTEGIRYLTEYFTGTKATTKSSLSGEAGRTTTQRLALDVQYFLSSLHRQVVAASMHLRDFRCGKIEVSDLFRLGGAATLRGYREAQFFGSRLAWSNLEYRLLVAPRSYVFGFLDAGYIFSPARPESGLIGSEQTKLGYGVGVRLDSPLGLLGVSLAFGQGDTFSTAKLHVQLVNEF
jgi:outer membrane protein assembly factor BamA